MKQLPTYVTVKSLAEMWDVQKQWVWHMLRDFEAKGYAIEKYNISAERKGSRAGVHIKLADFMFAMRKEYETTVNNDHKL